MYVRYVVALVVMGLALIGCTEASASPYPASGTCGLIVGTQSAASDRMVDIVGSGFPAGGTAHLSFRASHAALQPVRVSASGAFVALVTLPADVSSTDEVVATSADVTCRASLGTAGGTTGRYGAAGLHAADSTGGNPASTGFATFTASAVALALLVGGLLFILLGRRRREF